MPPHLPSPPAGSSRLSCSTFARISAKLAEKLALNPLYLPVGILLILLLVSTLRYAAAYQLRKRTKFDRLYQAPPEKALSAHSPAVRVPFSPIYPWMSPPKPLPGPYDPRLYPPVTIRRHSHSDQVRNAEPMQTNQVSYARRVSTNSVPAQASTLHGTVITASNGRTGWRRSHWVVEGG